MLVETEEPRGRKGRQRVGTAMRQGRKDGVQALEARHGAGRAI